MTAPESHERAPQPGILSGNIIGSFFQVYNELGPGFLESVYRGAMYLSLLERGVATQREAPVTVHYHGVEVGTFRIDLLAADRIAVELKAARAVEPAHEAQLINLLRATDLEVGILLNFGPRPTFKRLIYSNSRKTRGPAEH